MNLTGGIHTPLGCSSRTDRLAFAVLSLSYERVTGHICSVVLILYEINPPPLTGQRIGGAICGTGPGDRTHTEDADSDAHGCSSKMLCARRVTRAPGFARHFQTAATRKSRKFTYQAVSFAAACTVAGAAAAHLHLQNSVIHNDALPKDLPMSGEVNLKTSQKDRGKELLTSEGWGSNG